VSFLYKIVTLLENLYIIDSAVFIPIIVLGKVRIKSIAIV